jgi:hypothetical protein
VSSCRCSGSGRAEPRLADRGHDARAGPDPTWIVREITRAEGRDPGEQSASAIAARLAGEEKAELIVERLGNALGLGGAGGASREETFWAVRRLFEWPQAGRRVFPDECVRGTDPLPRFSAVDERLAVASDRVTTGKMSPFLLAFSAEPPSIGDIPGSVEERKWTADGSALLVLAADRGLDAAPTSGAVRLWWGDKADPDVFRAGETRRRLYRLSLADGVCREVGPVALTLWDFDLLDDNRAVALVCQEAAERGWYRARLAILVSAIAPPARSTSPNGSFRVRPSIPPESASPFSMAGAATAASSPADRYRIRQSCPGGAAALRCRLSTLARRRQHVLRPLVEAGQRIRCRTA